MPTQRPIEPTPLRRVIASNMRRIRNERGLLQEDVAAAARWVGLRWNSVTVTQMESGKRAIGLDEFLLLPLVLRCSVKDLLRADGEDLVELGYDTYLSPSLLADLASESGPRLDENRLPMVPFLGKLEDKIKRAIDQAELEPTLLTYLRVREAARGEAERKAAQTLKISAVQITAYALRLWGQSLTEERDSQALKLEAGEKETRAVRGHITRNLLNEIWDLSEEAQYGRPLSIVKLKPVSTDERNLRNISIEDYEKNEAIRKKAKTPYERWMRFKILEALEKEGTAR